MLLRKKIVYLLALSAVFAAGCAPAVKSISTDTPPPPVIGEVLEVAVEDVYDIPVEPEPEPADGSEAIDLTDVDGLLRMAREAVGDSAFAAADSMMRRVAAFLMRNSADAMNAMNALGAEDATGADAETAEDAELPLQNYIAEVISFYAEYMPAGFSVPEEISVLIFKQHLLESLLDSLEVSPRDSIFLHRLSNKRGVVYEVPMVWNDRVRRALMFYMRTRNGVFDRWLHRAGYYLPMMTQMFADAGLPRDLAYLPIIESGFNPYAYSRAHAAGIWQFIPSTGRNYKLRQNYWIDERRDPIKSTEGAIGYLSKLYGDFGDWHIALASYNCGENGMARAIRRADGLHDYWQLQLPKETMNYIPLFLASVLIARNPDVFDFALQDSVVFNPDTVSINSCIELKTIADGIGLPLDTLVRMNPHILHWATPPDMQNVRIYLPKGYADKFREFYAELPDEKRTKFHRYTVQPGDNMQLIARNFKVSAEAIRSANNMADNSVSAGRHLIIPVPANVAVPASLVKHLNTIDRRQQQALARALAAAAGPPMGSAPGSRRSMVPAAQQTGSPMSTRSRQAPRDGRRISYKVRAGESLYSIANTFGVTVNDLMAWNYLSSPRSLKAEQTLIIYQKEQQAPSAQRVRGPSTEHSGKHLVKQGETLYGISQQVGVSVAELAQINGLNPRRPMIFPGDVLVFSPGAGRAARAAAPAAAAGTAPAASVQTAAAQPAAAPARTGEVAIYTVKSGDNLWRIALNHGVTVDAIRSENNLSADTKIMPGDILRITR